MELPYPKIAEDLAERIKVIPQEAQPVLGRLIMNITDAHRWASLAFRNVPSEKRVAVTRRFDLGEEQVDAFDYCPEIDDVARTWDEASLWYAGEKCVQALEDARLSLAELENVEAFAFDWETPWGWIRVRGGGMFATTFMRSWVDFDYVTLAIEPMFLFSATFFPLATYPESVQWVVQLTPLYHGVALERPA